MVGIHRYTKTKRNQSTNKPVSGFVVPATIKENQPAFFYLQEGIVNSQIVSLFLMVSFYLMEVIRMSNYSRLKSWTREKEDCFFSFASTSTKVSLNLLFSFVMTRGRKIFDAISHYAGLIRGFGKKDGGRE